MLKLLPFSRVHPGCGAGSAGGTPCFVGSATGAPSWKAGPPARHGRTPGDAGGGARAPGVGCARNASDNAQVPGPSRRGRPRGLAGSGSRAAHLAPAESSSGEDAAPVFWWSTSIASQGLVLVGEGPGCTQFASPGMLLLDRRGDPTRFRGPAWCAFWGRNAAFAAGTGSLPALAVPGCGAAGLYSPPARRAERERRNLWHEANASVGGPQAAGWPVAKVGCRRSAAVRRDPGRYAEGHRHWPHLALPGGRVPGDPHGGALARRDHHAAVQ